MTKWQCLQYSVNNNIVDLGGILMKEELKTELENTCSKMGVLYNKLFISQEVGDPFYIINLIENDMYSFIVHAAPINNEITPILFLNKSLAETFIKSFHDARKVNGLSNFYFNVVYSIKDEQSICLVATKLDNQGNLILKEYTLKQIRKTYNLYTSDELKATFAC